MKCTKKKNSTTTYTITNNNLQSHITGDFENFCPNYVFSKKNL